MKKTLLLLGGAFLASTLSSSAVVLVAGWDLFSSIGNSAPTQQDPNTTVTLSSTTSAGTWDDWNNNVLAASDDGTFGSLSPTVAAASTYVGTGNNQNTNLSLNRAQADGTLVFTLTNASSYVRTFEGFYFDAIRRFGQSATTWSLAFSGAISGTTASGAIAQVDAGMSAATPAQRDHAVDLTGLADNVWEPGTSAIFTLTFSGATGSLSGGGQEAVLDNIGITVVSIPEPSSTALLGLAGFGCLFIRRRKDLITR